MLVKWLGLLFGGALGAAARYGLAGLVERYNSNGFPWGTWTVNMAGCFLFGLIWTLAQTRMLISPELRVVLLVGCVGSFTTFSTFVYESEQLLEHAQWGMAFLNMAGELLAGLTAYALGMWAGRLI